MRKSKHFAGLIIEDQHEAEHVLDQFMMPQKALFGRPMSSRSLLTTSLIHADNRSYNPQAKVWAFRRVALRAGLAGVPA